MAYDGGLHTRYKDIYRESQSWLVEQILKIYLSANYFLKLENLKAESLVIADKKAAVNFYRTLHTLPITSEELSGGEIQLEIKF